MTRISNKTNIFTNILASFRIFPKLLGKSKKKNREDLSVFPTRFSPGFIPSHDSKFLHHPFTRQPTDIETMGPVLSRVSSRTKVSDGQQLFDDGTCLDKYCIGGESVSRRATADAFEYKLGNIRTDSISRMDRSTYDLSNEKQKKNKNKRRPSG